jgi:hypothetical protein
LSRDQLLLETPWQDAAPHSASRCLLSGDEPSPSNNDLAGYFGSKAGFAVPVLVWFPGGCCLDGHFIAAFN